MTDTRRSRDEVTMTIMTMRRDKTNMMGLKRHQVDMVFIYNTFWRKMVLLYSCTYYS
jgi:hypothetical protein